MKTTNVAKSSGIGWLRPRAIRVGAAASGLAAVLCVWIDGGQAVPNETRQVHVEGQLLPVEQSPGVYRVTGGLVGTYRLRVSGSSTSGPIGRPDPGDRRNRIDQGMSRPEPGPELRPRRAVR